MTNKRNTLLYLDKDTVKAAKERGINISKVAEEALEGLVHETSFTTEKFLMRKIREGSAFIAPFKISRIFLRNAGVLGERTIDFKDRNLIVGGNATGKTTIFRLMKEALRRDVDDRFLAMLESESKGKERISLTIKTNNDISYIRDLNLFGPNDCLVLDDAFSMMDSKTKPKFLKYLVSTGAQLILTGIEVPKGADGFNIIGLSRAQNDV